MSAEDATGMETADVYVPSAFCLKKAELEVSIFHL
jgi:hypothetical protein